MADQSDKKTQCLKKGHAWKEKSETMTTCKKHGIIRQKCEAETIKSEECESEKKEE